MKTDRLRKSSFFSMLLALLGVGASSCIFITPPMYGSPRAEWSVKGKVVDAAGKPVPGLQVVLGNRYGANYDQEYWPLDTLQTGPDGVYQVQSGGFPLSKLQVDVHDIDGPDNGGEFLDAMVYVTDFKFENGDGAWYSGSAEINVPDITVTRK